MAVNSPVYITEKGLKDLKAELDELINVRRPALAQRLHVAIKQGDLSENADYIAAKEEQGFLEGRILDIQMKLRNRVAGFPRYSGRGWLERPGDISHRWSDRSRSYKREDFLPVTTRQGSDKPEGR